VGLLRRLRRTRFAGGSRRNLRPML